MLPTHYFRLICCPRCHGELTQQDEGELVCADCSSTYPVVEGIPLLLTELDTVGGMIKQFYDSGWTRNEDGVVRACVTHNVDFSTLGDRYVTENERRFKSEFSSGEFFLDAGSGALPRSSFSTAHTFHVCLDLSLSGLHEARRKLKDRGIYVLGSLLQLPLKDAAVSNALASHCLYHIDKDMQAKALDELHRVLSPGGKLLVFYANPRSLERLLIEKLARAPVAALDKVQGVGFYYYAHSVPAFLKLLSDSFKREECAVKTLRLFGRGTSRLVFKVPLFGSLVFRAITAIERRLRQGRGIPFSSYVAFVAQR